MISQFIPTPQTAFNNSGEDLLTFIHTAKSDREKMKSRKLAGHQRQHRELFSGNRWAASVQWCLHLLTEGARCKSPEPSQLMIWEVSLKVVLIGKTDIYLLEGEGSFLLT